MNSLFSKLGISWAHMEWSGLLIFIPLVAFLYFLSKKKRQEVIRLLGLKAQDDSYTLPKLRPFKNLLSLLGLFFLIVAAIGPQWGEKEHQVKTQGLDMCLALDLSKSMLAEDMSPSRLSSAKNSLNLFLPRLGGDRVTVVGFAGTSYVAAPLSIDHQALLTFVDVLEPDFLSDTSTNIPQALDTCLTALGLENVKESSQILDAASKAIVLVTDGEDTVNDDSKAQKRLEKLGIPVYAILMGTRKGGPIPLRDENGNLKTYLQDPSTGKPAITQIHDKYLRELTQETDGQIFYAEQGLSAWKALEEELGTLKRDTKEAGKKKDLEHRFMIPLILAFLFLILDFFLPETNLKFNDLKSFFKIGVFLVFFLSPKTFAEVADPRAVFKNNQAIKEHQNKESLRALQKQDEALSLESVDSQLRYNWASGRLLAAPQSDKKLPNGEPEKVNKDFLNQALKEFEKLESDLSKEKGDDKRLLESKIQFQKGAALEMMGENQKALESYYQSLVKNNALGKEFQNLKDKLNENSRVNISRLIRKMEDSQKSGGGGGGGGGGEGQSKDPSDGSEGGKDPKEPPKDGADGDQRQRPEKFTGTDIDEGQAKQILQSVSGEEKGVLKRKAQSESREKQNQKGILDGDDSPSGKPW